MFNHTLNSSPAKSESSAISSKEILIAEDDQSNAAQLRYHLNLNNYQIIDIVPTGEALIDALEYSSPDLILLDIQLAGDLDGVNVAEKLLSKYDIPIIYLTSQTDEKTLNRAVITEPSGYLVKPVNPTELHFTIEMAVYKHQIARTLQNNHTWLQTTLNSIGEGVISTNNNEEITFINPTGEKLLGLNHDQVIGKPLNSILKLEGIDNHEVIPHPVQLVINEGQPLIFDNCRLTEAVLNTSIVVDCTLSPIRDSKNSILGGIFVFRDISSRLKADRERHELEAQLRHASKMEAIGQLAGGISHEFNNIITGISNYEELISAKLDENSDTYQYHRTIRKKLDQATHLTRKLLAFSRKDEPELSISNINQVILDLSLFLQQTLTSDIEIAISLDDQVKLISTDPNAIEQILTNLCLNSRDALTDGGKINISTALVNIPNHRTYSNTALPDGDYIRVTVRDNGIGMGDEIIQHIFEPFYTTKGSDSGTGLGLSVVYGLVKQLGGWIFCNSIPTKGTKFELYFPATPS